MCYVLIIVIKESYHFAIVTPFNHSQDNAMRSVVTVERRQFLRRRITPKERSSVAVDTDVTINMTTSLLAFQRPTSFVVDANLQALNTSYSWTILSGIRSTSCFGVMY